MKKGIFIALTLVLIGACALLFNVFYKEAKNTAITKLNEEQMIHAKQAARGIEDFFATWTRSLISLSKMGEIIDNDALGKRSMKLYYEAHQEQITAITRMDERGIIIYNFPQSSSVGSDISDQKHVRELLRDHKPVISDVFRAVEGFDAVAIVVPVFRGAVFKGSVTVLVNFESLAKRYLDVVKIGKTGYAWVVSRDGTQLYSPITGFTGKNVFATIKGSPSLMAMVNDMLKGHEGTATYTFDRIGDRIRQIREYAVYIPIHIANTFWSIAVTSAEQDVLSGLISFRNKLAVVIVALFTCGMAFSTLGAKAWFIVKEEEKRKQIEKKLQESEQTAEKFSRAGEVLQKAHAVLEQRVEERTEELRKAYESLKQETRERERAEAQLRQIQKLEALGTLTGGIAHDFNNILAAMMGFAELAKDKVPEGSPEERYLRIVLDAGIQGRELIKQMLTFSRQSASEKKPLQLSTVMKETARFLRASIPSTVSIRVNVESESGLILADPVQIQQVLMNLCTNAAHAMKEKGGILDLELSDFSVLAPETGLDGMKPGLYMKLVVRDTGTGMPPEIVDRVFDPFFTTKTHEGGTGLGLSVVHGIVKQHDGHITVESATGKGSAFTVYLPQVTERPKAEAVSEEAVPTGNERILFVDDEKPLVQMGEALLTELGYKVTSLASSREALELLKQNPSRFDLVITDQTMPEMTGVELAREILAIRPELPVILCTGFSYLVDADSAKAAGIRAFVMKPLTKGEIARTVRKVLDG